MAAGVGCRLWTVVLCDTARRSRRHNGDYLGARRDWAGSISADRKLGDPPGCDPRFPVVGKFPYLNSRRADDRPGFGSRGCAGRVSPAPSSGAEPAVATAAWGYRVLL